MLASSIDHTLLKPEATLGDISNLCEEARVHGFYAVCVNPEFVPVAKSHLRDIDVKICTVVDFPLGCSSPRAKAAMAAMAIQDGADELDMVMPRGRFLSGDIERVVDHVRAVVDAAGEHTVKVILETALLTESQIRLACELAVANGARFVKTSTGFISGGATVEAVRAMRATVGPSIGVKAAGGIRDRATAQAMLDAGANRLGTSASVAIVTQC